MSLISRKALSLFPSPIRTHNWLLRPPTLAFLGGEENHPPILGALLTNEGGGCTRGGASGHLVKSIFKSNCHKAAVFVGLAFARITWPTPLLQRGFSFAGRVAKVALITGLTRARRNTRKHTFLNNAATERQAVGVSPLWKQENANVIMKRVFVLVYVRNTRFLLCKLRANDDLIYRPAQFMETSFLLRNARQKWNLWKYARVVVMGLDIFSALSVLRNLNTIFLLDIERAGQRMQRAVCQVCFIFFFFLRNTRRK